MRTVDQSVYDSPEGRGYVWPVNCVGVAGKGLALLMRQKFPEVYNVYRMLCLESRDLVKAGDVRRLCMQGTLHVFAFTKERPQNTSSPSIVHRALREIAILAVTGNLPSREIVVPLLGAGLGGVPKTLSEQAIRNHLGNIAFHTDTPQDRKPTFSLMLPGPLAPAGKGQV